MVGFHLPFIECIFLEFNQRGKTVLIGSVYRPPNSDINLFFEKIDFIAHELGRMQFSQSFICGDFNVNILDLESDTGHTFSNVMLSQSIMPVITKPTRIDDNNGTCSLLDNIFIPNPINYLLGLLLSGLSDHYPVFIICKDLLGSSHEYQSIGRVIEYRNLSEANLSNFYADLSNFNFMNIVNL